MQCSSQSSSASVRFSQAAIEGNELTRHPPAPCIVHGGASRPIGTSVGSSPSYANLHSWSFTEGHNWRTSTSFTQTGPCQRKSPYVIRNEVSSIRVGTRYHPSNSPHQQRSQQPADGHLVPLIGCQ